MFWVDRQIETPFLLACVVEIPLRINNLHSQITFNGKNLI